MTSPGLPRTFTESWVRGMLATVLGSADTEGVASALGELDRRAGDGDFGTNLTAAFTRMRDAIETTHPDTDESWLTTVSRGFLGTGGTSGTLFGMAFRDLARCTDVDTLGVDELSRGLTAALATVQRYGGAEVGHKTMVDALAPAAEALAEQVASGADPTAALDAAAAAAQHGALSTRDAVARRGRASYVGDVAVGVIDPGAVALALVLQCAASAARGDGDAADLGWAL